MVMDHLAFQERQTERRVRRSLESMVAPSVEDAVELSEGLSGSGANNRT